MPDRGRTKAYSRRWRCSPTRWRNTTPRTRSLYFDVTTLGAPATPDTAQRWAAAMIRQIGVERVVFGSDATMPNVSPHEAWAALRKLLPLTDDEFRAIAGNVAPYMQ